MHDVIKNFSGVRVIMEANKSEAERCLEIAKKALKDGDLNKARRFANKSLKLCSTQQAEGFLSELGNDVSSSRSEGEEDGVRERRKNDSTTRETEEEAVEVAYTPEQKEAVDRVLRCTDYYDILGVSHDATDADLKKQYRKLALQLHPDKNQAPKADDAFKAVSKSYTILSDEDKRSQYDRFGEKGIQGSSGHSFHRHGYHAEMDAEELFRTFFGANFTFENAFMGGGNVRRRHRYYYHSNNNDRREPASGWVQFFQMMPILLILTMSLISTFLYPYLNSPPYLLYRTSTHPIERHTKLHDIPYYVTDSFSKDYPTADSIRRLERDVLSVKKYDLREECYQARRIQRYRHGNTNNNNQPKSCQELERLMKG